MKIGAGQIGPRGAAGTIGLPRLGRDPCFLRQRPRGYGDAETLFPRAFAGAALKEIQIATKVGWAPKDPDREMDHRRGAIVAEHVEATRPAMERFARIAEGLGRSRAQVAIRWVADRDDTVALFGAKTAQQVDENVGGAGWRLDAGARTELESLFAA